MGLKHDFKFEISASKSQIGNRLYFFMTSNQFTKDFNVQKAWAELWFIERAVVFMYLAFCVSRFGIPAIQPACIKLISSLFGKYITLHT